MELPALTEFISSRRDIALVAIVNCSAINFELTDVTNIMFVLYFTNTL